MTSLPEVVILGVNLPNTVVTHWGAAVAGLYGHQDAVGTISG